MDVVFPSQTKLLLGDETEIFCENLDKCSIGIDLLILDGCFNGFDIVAPLRVSKKGASLSHRQGQGEVGAL